MEQVLQSFWKRWRKDYPLELRSTHVGKKNKESNFKVNDIVIVLDGNQKRNKWRLGKIEKLIAGKNRIIRGAEVKVAEQNKKPIAIMRPLQKLFPLEMKENEISPSSNPRMKKTDKQTMNYQSRSSKMRRKRTIMSTMMNYSQDLQKTLSKVTQNPLTMVMGMNM